MSAQDKIAIYYEHTEWFKPLFKEFERRGVPYEKLFAPDHWFDPEERESPFALVVNRMSPSAYLRGHSSTILYTLQYLAHLDEIGANVVNGYAAFRLETSKARQLDLLKRLGLRAPRARVIHEPEQSLPAARGLSFPILVKPNIGGSGARIRRFESSEELEEAVARDELDLGIDDTALVQEYLVARDGYIVRVETLGQEYLYAIKVYPKPEEGFNLCPADICRPGTAVRVGDAAPAVATPSLGLQVEGMTPPPEVIANVKRIMRAAQIDVGGVEYLVNERDGEVYYYDINALSNFVSDARNVIGFDPFPRLVDYLIRRTQSRYSVPANAGLVSAAGE